MRSDEKCGAENGQRPLRRPSAEAHEAGHAQHRERDNAQRDGAGAAVLFETKGECAERDQQGDANERRFQPFVCEEAADTRCACQNGPGRTVHGTQRRCQDSESVRSLLQHGCMLIYDAT